MAATGAGEEEDERWQQFLSPESIPVEQTGHRPKGAVEVTVRPKPWLVVLILLGWVLLLCGGASALGPARFDARVAFGVLVSGAWVAFAAPARLVVADRTLRRVTLFRGGIVSLDALATVGTRRAIPAPPEGFGGIEVEVVDRFGRRIAFKPRSWSKGARPVLAVIAACVAAQEIDVEPDTAERLAAARADVDSVPTWALLASPGAVPDPDDP